jgi:hypothetical protein
VATLVSSLPPAPDPLQPVDELLGLLEAVASGQAAGRALAVRYMDIRADLLRGALSQRLPPFLLQCVSLSQFHDFITLFAPDRERRVAFLQQAFQPCRAPRPKRAFDIFD